MARSVTRSRRAVICEAGESYSLQGGEEPGRFALYSRHLRLSSLRRGGLPAMMSLLIRCYGVVSQDSLVTHQGRR
jgi:hypothetical protein